jgi:hypothetical protein
VIQEQTNDCKRYLPVKGLLLCGLSDLRQLVMDRLRMPGGTWFPGAQTAFVRVSMLRQVFVLADLYGME